MSDANSDLLEMTQTTLIDKFATTMGEFLEALAVVYPECDKVALYEKNFRTTVIDAGETIRRTLGETAMDRYHDTMTPWYSQCSACDESLIQESIEFLDELGLREKWAVMRDDHKETIWEFINMINGFCMIRYSANSMPDSIKNVLSTTASSLAEQMDAGGSPDFMGITRTVMENINLEDVQEWCASSNSMVMDMNTAKNFVNVATSGALGDSVQGFDVSDMMGLIANMPSEIQEQMLLGGEQK